MDRNREARRAVIAASNGVSRRRHRTGSLRDSPDEDGAVELQESMSRLRERGLKKDRDRDRERDRSGRSKRRRGERLIHGNSREDGGDDTSEESVNEEDEEYDEDVQASTRSLPPNPVQSFSNHHSQHRKILPPADSRNLRAPGLKHADEMIGVSVPRKARSASTKRLHEWISGGGGGIGGDIIHRQESASPVRQSQAAPVSPSSSNASFRKKMKPNGAKSRPPKSSRPAANPEELEIEIAEVLFGLRAQPQGPSTKETASSDTNKIDSKEVAKTSTDAKSRTSSPTSNNPSIFPQSSPLLPQNSISSGAPISAVAPKRKKPRHVSENIGNFSSRSSPVSATTMKTEIDQHLNTEISSPSLEKNSGIVAENPLSSPAPAPQPQYQPQEELKREVSPLSESNPSGEEARDLRLSMSTKKEVTSKKESPPVGLVADREDVTATLVDKNAKNIEGEEKEKFQIDLMAPQFWSSPNRDDGIGMDVAGNHSFKGSSNNAEIIDKQGNNKVKIDIGEAVDEDKEKEKAKAIIQESVDLRDSVLKKENVNDLKHLPRPDRDGNHMGSDNKSMLQQEVPKPTPQPTKFVGDEQKKEKTAQLNSFPLPMAVASWPGGLPPMGYMAPFQGLVSMEGSTMPTPPIQPLFSQPRGKRCATHYYIAQNIHYIQQLMKPAAVGSAPIFGAKPCNFNNIPPAEFNGNITGRSVSSLHDKGQQIITIFPGNSEKDRSLLQNDQRKQQPVLLQQTVPPVPPNNILHGPAFVFPFNQQQAAAVVAATARPGSAKSPTTPVNLSSNSLTAGGSTPATTSAATTVSFNYSNMSPSEAQYLAIFQNNGYPFPMAAPPNYRGTHPQAMPMFNGSFYPSQMIHPSQLQQPQLQQSSGSSSSQKHLQGQQHQRPQVSSVNGGIGAGNLQNFPPPKTRLPPQQQNHPMPGHENEVGSKDNNTPSTADSRVSSSSCASVYGQNFSMSIHPSFGMVSPTSGGGNQNEKKQQQQQQPQQQASLKPGPEVHPPQTFAMSFAPPNSSDTSTQERKGGHAVKSPPSIAFSRSEVVDVSGGSASPSNITLAATDSSARPVNAAPGSFNISSSHLSALYQNQKLDQQQLIKLHKLQQHHHDQQQQHQHQIAAAAAAARGKTAAQANGSTYPEHVKFQNVLGNFPQPYKQKNTSTSGSSPPPQWKNSTTVKTPNLRVPTSLSSSSTPPKNHVQNQARLQQISFGSAQKPMAVATNAQPQPPNNHPSPPSAAVGSPTHSSVSRGTSGSPRSITASTSHKTNQASVQTQKPSILGNPPNITTVPVSSSSGMKSQMQQQQQSQQFSKQAQQQTQQLFFSNHHYMQQPQGGPHSMGSTVSASSGYYLQRKRPEQQQQQLSQQPPGSTGMMLLSPVPVTSSAISDPTKSLPGASISKGHSSGSMHQLLPSGFSYTVQAGVQAKPPEQKQPAA